MRLFARSNGRDFEFDVRAERDRVVLRSGGKEIEVFLDDSRAAVRTAFVGDRRIEFGWHRRDDGYSILIDGIDYEVGVRDPRMELLSRAARLAPAETGAAEVRAPIPGLITRLLKPPGGPVRKGQPVLCLDAMKLENEIAAPRDGRLVSVEVRAGQAVEKGQLLFVIG
jgi:biotin carboxyl carrier protein